MARRRRDSCLSEKAMGGLWSKFEPIPTESGSGVAAISLRPSDGRVDGVSWAWRRADAIDANRLSDGRLDGVAWTWPRIDAIFMILKFKQDAESDQKT
jgi:hypothetical protein